MPSAQSTAANDVDGHAQDILSIEQRVADAERFQSDPEKFSQLLTPDVALINVAGIRLVGRDEIYRAMKSAMTTSLADIVTKHNAAGQITFLRPDVALISGIKRIFDNAGDPETEVAKSRFTFVLTKDRANWLIASIQNTPILS